MFMQVHKYFEVKALGAKDLHDVYQCSDVAVYCLIPHRKLKDVTSKPIPPGEAAVWSLTRESGSLTSLEPDSDSLTARGSEVKRPSNKRRK